MCEVNSEFRQGARSANVTSDRMLVNQETSFNLARGANGGVASPFLNNASPTSFTTKMTRRKVCHGNVPSGTIPPLSLGTTTDIMTCAVCFVAHLEYTAHDKTSTSTWPDFFSHVGLLAF